MENREVESINEVVSFSETPSRYSRVVPFSITVHAAQGDLTLPEKCAIQDAIVNVAWEIKRKRGQGGDSYPSPFNWENPSESKDQIKEGKA